MSKTILILDDVIDDTTYIDELYDIFVHQNINISIDPPNFIYKNDLDCREEYSDIDNILRDIIYEIWMQKAHFLIKDRMSELVGFECWNNNLPNENLTNVSLPGGNSGLNYHLDKDEVAAKNGELHLPMFATAFYIGPKEGLNGGELYVNTKGIEHYENYSGGLVDYKDDNSWLKIPYKYNRVVIFDATCPHFVMPVVVAPLNQKRCSVAINAWNRDLGIYSNENN